MFILRLSGNVCVYLQCCSHSFSSSDSLAPTISAILSPLLKNLNVGMALISYFWAISCQWFINNHTTSWKSEKKRQLTLASSTSTLMKTALGNCVEYSSNLGPILLHGGHLNTRPSKHWFVRFHHRVTWLRKGQKVKSLGHSGTKPNEEKWAQNKFCS